jgi:cell division GTPase FtsZ
MTDVTCNKSFEVKTLKGIKAIVDCFVQPNVMIQIDENDLRELMDETQDALVVTGIGDDESSLTSLAENAVKKLQNADVSISRKGVFFEIASHEDMPLMTMTMVAQAVSSNYDEDAAVLWSHRTDPQLGDKVKITIASPIL